MIFSDSGAVAIAKGCRRGKRNCKGRKSPFYLDLSGQRNEKVEKVKALLSPWPVDRYTELIMSARSFHKIEVHKRRPASRIRQGVQKLPRSQWVKSWRSRHADFEV